MEIDMYAVSLEHYVKTYVDFTALNTAKERGTYDKAIMRFVLDFTRKSAPKRVWGVDRSQLVADMGYVVERFSTHSLIRIDGKAFAYMCKDGDIRILYAGSVDEYVNKLNEIPNVFSGAFLPISDFVEVREIRGDHIITAEDERIDLEYRLADSIVNVLERIYERSDNL